MRWFVYGTQNNVEGKLRDSLFGAVRGWVAVNISFKRRFVHCIIQSFFNQK